MQPVKAVQILGDNVSYQAKGAYILARLVDAGLVDGGLLTRAQVLAAPQKIDGAVVVLADAYHLDGDHDLREALSNSHVLLAPSVLRRQEAVHARSLGATMLSPRPKDEEIDDLVADGTVRIVGKIPAAPLADALDKLGSSPKGVAAAEAMKRIVNDYNQHTFIYPCGDFSVEGGDKARLTMDDTVDLITAVRRESIDGSVVICGGRVNADVVGHLKRRFAGRENIVILSQNDHDADLPSAYTSLVQETGRKPQRVLIDGLARTTLEVVALSAGLTGEHGPVLMTSEKMVGDAKRERQVAEYYTTYGGTSLVSLGKSWVADLITSAPAAGPDLDAVLGEWLSDKRILCTTPKANHKQGVSVKPETK